MSSGATVSCVTVAAIALMQLSDRLDGITGAFFSCTLTEQCSLMALIFATVFAAVSFSHSLGEAKPADRKKGFVVQRKIPEYQYPLAELLQCKDDSARFKCLYPMLRDEILDHMRQNNEMPEESVQWVAEMLDFNVPGGKLNRGTTVLAVYKALMGGRNLTELEVARAAVLGWSIEFLQAFFLVADDIMDDSQTRRGQPCWYKLPKVKLIAINDSFLLESFVFSILRHHFQHEPYYTELVDLLLDVTQKTEVGQLLDLTSQPHGGPIDLDRFTLERYKSIVKYKTAFYSFYLPVALGMLMAGIDDVEAYNKARRILMIMGEYFQVQDDVLDCFGDPAVIGKVGTDIQDNKCSWLVVQALQRCTPAQRQVLKENYGVWDDAKVATVKSLYQELGLKEVFAKYEEDSYQQIQDEMDKVTNMPRDVFEVLLQKIYKRSK